MIVAYRLAGWDTPLWVTPNPAAARFNRAGEGPTQYLSLHPMTPWAEYLRANELSAPEDLLGLRLRLWALRIDPALLVEVTFANAAGHGIEAADLVASDWSACQRLGSRLRHDGADGIVVPSAALPGTRNVVLFGPRVASGYLGDPIDPAVDVPVAHAAEAAGTIPGLLALVARRRGRHAGLVGWRRGAEFVFVEPAVPA